MSKQKKPEVSHETDRDLLVKIELISINEKPFLGSVSDDELIYIWVHVFGCKLEDLFGVTSTKSLTRNVRGTFKLKTPVKIQEKVGGANFRYEKFLDDGACETITGKILGFDAPKPAELGELTKVTIKTNFGVEPSGIVNWLRLYGTLTAQQGDFTINKKTGVRSDVFEAEVVLKKHIHEYLPMYGQKVQVYYPGIPRMCNRCFIAGHLRRECNNKKRDWIEYIFDFLNGGLNPELIGSWEKAVTRWRNANSNPERRPE